MAVVVTSLTNISVTPKTLANVSTHTEGTIDHLHRFIAPLGSCCDCCDEASRKVEAMRLSVDHPKTPTRVRSNTLQSSPTKSPNINRKRPMIGLASSAQPHLGADIPGPPTSPCKSHGLPATRRSDHLTEACTALVEWRTKTLLTRYTPSPFTAEAILPDSMLTTLASNARIRSLADMTNLLDTRWMLVSRHGEEIIKLLQEVDEKFRLERVRQKEEKRAMKKAAARSPTSMSYSLHGSALFNILRFDPAQVSFIYSCSQNVALRQLLQSTGDFIATPSYSRLIPSIPTTLMASPTPSYTFHAEVIPPPSAGPQLLHTNLILFTHPTPFNSAVNVSTIQSTTLYVFIYSSESFSLRTPQASSFDRSKAQFSLQR